MAQATEGLLQSRPVLAGLALIRSEQVHTLWVLHGASEGGQDIYVFLGFWPEIGPRSLLNGPGLKNAA